MNDRVAHFEQVLDTRHTEARTRFFASWSFHGIVAAISTLTVALSWFPAAQVIHGTTPLTATILIVATAIMAHLIGVAAVLTGGEGPIWTRSLRWLSIGVDGGVFGLIAAAGGGVTIAWIWLVALWMDGVQHPPQKTRFIRAFNVLFIVACVVYVGWGHGLERGLITLVVVMSLAYIARGLSLSAQNTRRVQAENLALQDKLARVGVLAERERIRQDLHDGLGAELTGLLWRHRESGDGEMEGHVRRCLDELRQIVWAMQPEELLWEDVLERFEGRLQTLCGQALTLDFEVEGAMPEEMPSREGVYQLLRVLQEAAQNTLRHAAAQRLEVRVRFEPDRLSIEVRDDGRGFDMEAVSARGLRHLQNRLEALDGEVEIEGGAGRGAMLRFGVPLVRLAASDDLDGARRRS